MFEKERLADSCDFASLISQPNPWRRACAPSIVRPNWKKRHRARSSNGAAGRLCRAERIEGDVGVTGGWIQGKPVNALMRQLMEDARDDDVYVADETPAFYASQILERWGWLSLRRGWGNSLWVRLTDRGREVLRDA
jgi:hypothetical protein